MVINMDNVLINYIKKEFSHNKVDIYVDMDGVIVDYDLINYSKEKENDNVYLNKRPINTVINILKDVSKLDNVKIHILSISRYERQMLGKLNWLEKNISFVDNENINIIPRDINNFEKAEILKSNFFTNLKNNNKIILIDDSHSVLQTIFKNNHNIIPLHISSILN